MLWAVMGRLIMVLTDVVLAALTIEGVGALFHAFLFPDTQFGLESSTVQFIAIVALTVFWNYAVSLYDRDVLVSREALVPRVLVATVGATLGALLVQYFVWYVPNGRLIIVGNTAALAMVILLSRMIVSRRLRRSPPTPVAVYGTARVCAELHSILGEQAFCPFEIKSFVVDTREEVPSPTPLPEGVERLAGAGAVAGLRERGIEVLVMGTQGALGSESLSNMTLMQTEGMRIRSAAAFVADVAGYIPIHIASLSWIIGALERIDGRSWTPIKRAVDVGLAVVGLSIAAVLSPLLVVLVKSDRQALFLCPDPRRSRRAPVPHLQAPHHDTRGRARRALRDR